MLKSGSALKLGYRYYWDDWDVKSHTVDLRLDQRFDSGVMIGTGIRLYSQSRAFFFEPVYTRPQDFMTVDSKLDKTFSAEFEVEAVWDGTKVKTMPVLGTFFSDQSDLTLRFDLYVRHTASPNWFSGSQTLLAGIVGVGYRYRF
jgi:hypothetical protein